MIRLPLIRSRPTRKRRAGIVTVELLLTLPVLLVFLAAVIQFALIYSVNQKVAYASRFGARLASEEPRTSLDDLNLSGGGSRLRTAINNYLANADLTTGACTVILEHNACLANQTQTDTDGSGCNCGAPAAALPAGPPPAGTPEYVRVTVCVPLTGNVPDLLSSFGFSVAGCTIEHTTLFRYEPNNAVPNVVVRAPVQALPGGFTASPDITTTALTCPPTTTLTVFAANSTATGATVDLDFDGLSTTDAEDPFASLSFAWATSGVPVGPTNGTAFTGRFTVPGTAGGAPASTTETVTVAVTDTCGGVGSHVLIVEVNRLP